MALRRGAGLDAPAHRDPPRVLIVDDDVDIRETVSDVLRAEGYSVETADDGQMALDVITAAVVRPNLVLLDMMMPGMTGEDVLAELSARGLLSGLSIVLFTAHHRAAPHAGVRGLVRKPIDLDALVLLVEKFCRDTGA